MPIAVAAPSKYRGSSDHKMWFRQHEGPGAVGGELGGGVQNHGAADWKQGDQHEHQHRAAGHTDDAGQHTGGESADCDQQP